MSDAVASVPAKKPFPKFLVVICGVVAMIAGGAQMYRGFGEMFGSGDSAQTKQLLAQSDQTFAEGQKSLADVGPRFETLLVALDNDGLEKVRQQKQQEIRAVADQWDQLAEKCRTAAKQLDDAATHPSSEPIRPYLASMSKAYVLFAQAYGRNGEITRLVRDDPTKELKDLLPKFSALAEQREAEIKQGNDATAHAEELSKQFKK